MKQVYTFQIRIEIETALEDVPSEGFTIRQMVENDLSRALTRSFPGRIEPYKVEKLVISS